MLSVPDIAILGAVALLVFGPEQLPKVARKVGGIMRDVQNTSHQFIREMERAADDVPEPAPYDPAAITATDPVVHETAPSHEAGETVPPAPPRVRYEPAEY